MLTNNKMQTPKLKSMQCRFFLLLIAAISFVGCHQELADKQSIEKHNHKMHVHTADHANKERKHDHATHGAEEHTLHLTMHKFNNLGIKVDTIPKRTLSGMVEANGRLALFPQHRATVTAILGANVTEIKVIEGEKVKKGQILAYLSHPNLTNLQTAYVRAYNQMQFLEKEYGRQKRLYDEGVSSGKVYQQTRADYHTIIGETKGLEAQLKQLSIDAKRIREGNIFQYVPLISPIDGYIEKVSIQIGQFVDPQTEILSITNNDHIHADLLVFEKDIYKVKEGQKVFFTVTSVPGKTLSATIFSVGKNFEQNPRAVHIHAKIDQKEYFLIPGMYINGKIQTRNESVNALPEDAIIVEEGKSYIFMAETQQEVGERLWVFSPIEIRKGISHGGWVEVDPLEPLPIETKVAWNKAYYLIAEMKKSETAHEH